MRRHHRNHNPPTRPLLHNTNNRPQIADQKPRTDRQPDSHKHPIQHRDRTPTDQRHGDPDDIAIPVQRPALDETDALARASRTPTRAVPPQQPPQHDGHHERIPIHQPRGAAQQPEIVREVLCAFPGEVLADGAGDEEDEDDGGGDPEGAVEVWVAF